MVKFTEEGYSDIFLTRIINNRLDCIILVKGIYYE
jgi:hypothetical protein